MKAADSASFRRTDSLWGEHVMFQLDGAAPLIWELADCWREAAEKKFAFWRLTVVFGSVMTLLFAVRRRPNCKLSSASLLIN